jgi:hypothetical protein
VNREVPAAHVSDDDLHLYILGRLNAEEVTVFQQHLVDCLDCANRLDAAARLVATILNVTRYQADKRARAQPLLQVSDVVLLRPLAPFSPERWRVKVLYVSEDSFGLLVPIRLSQGAVVQLQHGLTLIVGEVIDSRQLTHRQFEIGIRVQT